MGRLLTVYEITTALKTDKENFIQDYSYKRKRKILTLLQHIRGLSDMVTLMENLG